VRPVKRGQVSGLAYTPGCVAVMVEMYHTGCVPVVRAEIVAVIEHALSDRLGDWRVLTVGSEGE
jgi:hypothetical protein